MKRVQKQLSISAFTQIKRNKIDNPTSENVSIDQANLSEQPSISKNDTDNHNIVLTPDSNNSMTNNSNKTLTAGENDIGNYVHNLEINDLKKEELLKTPWVPHSTYIFPVKTKRNLRFQLSWIKRFSWLSYSQIFEGAFCRPCVLFVREKGGKGGHQQLGALVSKEYTNWKNALQDFQLHASTSYHKLCVEKSDSFLKVNEGRSKNITEQLSIERSRQIEQNRNILLSVIKTIILCSKQEIDLRGSNDFGNVMNINTFNDGNFRALLRFRVDSGDTILEEHLKNGPKNSLYTSPGIQNEIISICGDIVKSKIIQRVNAAECFSVLADETTDIGRIEQMSVCLRYFDQGEKKIREDFLEFTPAVDLTGKGLATLIMSSLQNNGINCQFLVGQGYDGASAMSGYLHGAQEYIKKDFPMALYVHCSAHSLNLALANASSLPTIRNCISTIQTVGTFFRSSAQRSEVLRISIIETLPQARHSTLVALCETRWVYKHESVLRFKELYPAIIVALEKLESLINKETAQKSCQLLSSIKDAKFVIPLIIIENIFSYTLTLCKQLQTINADLVEACNHVDDVLAILDEMRENNNKHFSDMFSVAAIMMNKNKEEIDFPRFANRQTQRNNVPANNSEEYYKLNIFLPFLDHIRIQLSDRFQKHKFLIKSLQQIIPSKCIHSTSEEMNDCVQFYSRILTEPTVFKAEFSIWKSKWLKEESRPNTAIEGLDNCNILLFPNIWKLLQVLATIPMSTATPERTFSSLKRLKTYLRNSTGETRLNGLALMSIHREINVDPEEVLNRFAKQSRRMMIL
ncbi:52 kDa repressor of the inhibitor of the protein kinase-like [Myzus persicae]|uniref:52 kDa repressor of the inhibitor of the protein kinase-like n=2 Tax=Myzus persicae TaxID=13164 RepID=UPI000B934F67|nr:52 kDa repressor of the inhibitor of the protein kinase-like [Myzus persicae]